MTYYVISDSSLFITYIRQIDINAVNTYEL